MSGLSAYRRLYRGETSFDFAGRWKRWFTLSGVVILVGLISLGVRGLNFSIDFKGGTVWEVPSTASVAKARSVVGAAVPGFGQATIQTLTNTLTHQKTIKVEAQAKITNDPTQVRAVQNALAKMAGVSVNDVQLNEVGPSWGSDITNKAIEAVIIFLVVVAGYIWLRFDAKMAVAALVALIHDILVTVGIYSLSGFQVSPDTVIAFLTILGYSLYDTIVVFDRVQENTRGLASTNRLTYSDVVNLSMNQVLARSLNTSLVAILPILSILVIGAWILGATALQDFGLALFVGLTTGAYSSIFIASPLLAVLKEREPRYSEIRRRLASGTRRITPVAAAAGDFTGTVGLAPPAPIRRRRATSEASSPAAAPSPSSAPSPTQTPAPPLAPAASVASSDGDGDGTTNGHVPEPQGDEKPAARTRGATPTPPRQGNRPPPRPRKKGKRR